MDVSTPSFVDHLWFQLIPPIPFSYLEHFLKDQVSKVSACEEITSACSFPIEMQYTFLHMSGDFLKSRIWFYFLIRHVKFFGTRT